MKKRNLLILAGVLLLVLLIELYATGAFSSLQGRLSVTPGSLNRGPVYSLAASSPSGSRSVSTSDSVFVFDASGKLTIPQGTIFEFKLETGSEDMNSSVANVSVGLYHEGNLVGERTDIVDEDGSVLEEGRVCSYSEDDETEGNCYVFIGISLDQRIWLGSGTKTFEIQVDTDALLADDSAEDDPLDITMTVGSQTVVGNTLNY